MIALGLSVAPANVTAEYVSEGNWWISVGVHLVAGGTVWSTPVVVGGSASSCCYCCYAQHHDYLNDTLHTSSFAQCRINGNDNVINAMVE